LQKSYGAVPAVRGIDLDIEDGEFTVLVGPSGCGKSTLLRTIAGLETPDAGTIAIGGAVVNDMRPRERNIAMVFQNYALYPYLTVYENIAFGLRARRFPSGEIDRRVREAAAMLGIANLLERFPRQLSGGQRQRVAIGRATVRQAQLFLFDEPLSNLDAKLRDEMRGEIKQLHAKVDTTMIYVTHDQVEAMTLADRIVLLKDGQIEQQGRPLDLFERPVSRFVAGFLGSPSINILRARLAGDAEGAFIVLDTGELMRLPASREPSVGGEREILLGVRPEHFSRAPEGALRPGSVRIEAVVDLIQPTGTRTYVTTSVGGSPVTIELQSRDVQQHGETIDLALDLNRAILIDPSTDRVLQ
jgi:multiple sugar transport system ATP-binding protein